MLKSYFRTAWRNFRKNKMHSVINTAGLSVGMAVAMLIGLWISDELSFDKYNPQYGRIAQVKQNVTNNGEVQTWENVPYPLANELRKSYGNDLPLIAMTTGTTDHILTYGEKILTQTGTFFEPQGPELLGLKMIRGTRDGLKEPTSILLSESLAKAYFGDVDPMGKTMKIENRQEVKVTGVYQDFPDNSSFASLNFIAPWQLYYNNTEWVRTMSDPWRPNAFNVYVRIADNTDMASVSAKIRDAKLNKVSKELAKKKPALFLHPMSKWHLYDEFKEGRNTGGNIQFVWLFGIIGVFVLLLACINFMNLSTAKSEKRAREVGVRKAIGSLRVQLILQFFSESLLVVLFSFVLSLLLVQLMLPFFNSVADKKIAILWNSPLFWLLSLAFSLVTALIAGSYPALYLSSFRPVKVLKGTFRSGPWAAVPRKALVVLQFTASIALIIGTIVVFNQIRYAQNRPLGYDRDGLVSVPSRMEEIHKHFDAVKEELVSNGAITAMAEAGSPTTSTSGSSSGFSWKDKDPNLSIDFPFVNISYDYGKTINWRIRAGRDFSRDFATDSAALIINESAARFMGLKTPVGETIRWFGQPYTVIGVAEDMIMQSPYAPVMPTVFVLSNDPGSVAILKINPAASAQGALDKIEKVFKKFNPSRPFEYKFADEAYAKKFGNETRIGKLASFFAILAVFISCLGLSGLASFVAEQRIREIGVRKVLGASVINLWGLLSKEFVALVMLSCIIAAPLASYFLNQWLRKYAYHTQISWTVFAATGLGALVITLLTVSRQAIKAALMNPVKSLRSE